LWWTCFGLAQAWTTRSTGFTCQIDAQSLLSLINQENGIKIELREQVQVMSGGRAEFQSGDVMSDVTCRVLPNAQEMNPQQHLSES
jgi:hypothetical protein